MSMNKPELGICTIGIPLGYEPPHPTPSQTIAQIFVSVKVAVPTGQMKQTIEQLVDNDHRNNLVKFEKDSPFHFWVFE